MADTSELIKTLLAAEPQEPHKPNLSEFKTVGRGGRETVDQGAYRQALDNYNNVLWPNYQTRHTDWQAKLNPLMGQATTAGASDLAQSEALKNYLSSGEHRAWELGSTGSLLGGVFGGRGLAAMSGVAPPGAGRGVRGAKMIVPTLEALLAGGKGYEQYATRPEQVTDPRGYDLHNWGTATGLGLASGAFTGGISNALANPGKGVTATPELPPEVPPSPQPIGKKGDPHSAVVNEIATRLGVPTEKAKKETYAAVSPRLLKADEPTLRKLAEDIHAYSPEALSGVKPDAPLGKLRTAVINYARKVGTSPGVLKGLGILAPLGALAVEGASTSPVKAENYGYKPGEDTLLPALSPGERALWGATNASDQLLAAAKEHPEYLVPYLGGAAAARDIAQGIEAHPAWENTPPLTLKNAASVGRQYAEDAKAVRNLEHAKAEDQRQRAELFAQHPELAPPRERPPIKEEEMFPGMVQKPPAEPYAMGGKVSSPAHARAMNAKLSAMQHELQRALSVAVKRLEKLGSKKGADRAAGKLHREKEDLIEDIWGLHELAQKIVGGKLLMHPNISKKELIGLARQHASSGTSSS